MNTWLKVNEDVLYFSSLQKMFRISLNTTLKVWLKSM